MVFIKEVLRCHCTFICRRILRIIDQAEYCSEKTFIGRDKSLGALFTDNLSTGTKTLLNISQHRSLCYQFLHAGMIEFQTSVAKVSVDFKDKIISMKRIQRVDCGLYDVIYNPGDLRVESHLNSPLGVLVCVK